jgi:hypothetical protein
MSRGPSKTEKSPRSLCIPWLVGGSVRVVSVKRARGGESLSRQPASSSTTPFDPVHSAGIRSNTLRVPLGYPSLRSPREEQRGTNLPQHQASVMLAQWLAGQACWRQPLASTPCACEQLTPGTVVARRSRS